LLFFPARRSHEVNVTIALDELKELIRRWTVLLGVLQVTLGCLIGFIPPTAVAWFRGIVMAHIEYTANGVLMIALGLILPQLRLGSGALKVWFWLLQLGTWTNGGAGLMGAFLGSSSPLLPVISKQFPPPGGSENHAVTASLLVCGVTLMICLILTIVGLARSMRSQGRGQGAATQPPA
jgi:hypothetical protein